MVCASVNHPTFLDFGLKFTKLLFLILFSSQINIKIRCYNIIVNALAIRKIHVCTQPCYWNSCTELTTIFLLASKTYQEMHIELEWLVEIWFTRHLCIWVYIVSILVISRGLRVGHVFMHLTDAIVCKCKLYSVNTFFLWICKWLENEVGRIPSCTHYHGHLAMHK